MTNTHRSTVTGPTDLHLSPSPVPSVITGHRHRSHRSPPATVTGPISPTGLHRLPSPVPPVLIGHRHRSHRSPPAIGHRHRFHRSPQAIGHRSSPATVTSPIGPTGLHRPPSSVPRVFTGHRHQSHRFSSATVIGHRHRFHRSSSVSVDKEHLSVTTVLKL